MNYEGLTSALLELRQLKKDLQKIMWDMEDTLGEKSPNHFQETKDIALAYRALWQDMFEYTYKIQDLLGDDNE